ncbi:hypothetical protein [Paenibacillus sp. ATY16]|uniref:hypothetical protein n=1 Tax=Paenibacillus sp. ATY16 TaxID=1759312 RepID=UPI000E2E7C56|nr:hypothetical protein [Paenibacillus sp. ATY16]MCK9859478.1 hypothetical protein [Paenibacillus sp. ATY16]
MREMECWKQYGFALFPRAVTHFYALRYLLWVKELPFDQPYDIHHQYLWDIRMHEPVYEAFSEILGTTALWAHLCPGEPATVKGGICLQQSVQVPVKQWSIANIGDLFIYNAEECRIDLDAMPDYSWLPMTYFPAAPDNRSLLKERLRSWKASPNQAYLSARGNKLLGFERW